MSVFAADSCRKARIPASCAAPCGMPPPIEQALLGVLALAVLALLIFPAARGVSEVLGWLPLWLPGLPGCAWAALRLRRWREEVAAVRRTRAPQDLARVHSLRPPQARRAMPATAGRARAA